MTLSISNINSADFSILIKISNFYLLSFCVHVLIDALPLLRK